MTHTRRTGQQLESTRTYNPRTHNLLSIILLVVVLTTLILQSGCIGITGASGGTNPVTPATAPQITANPPTLSFGSIQVGSSGTSSITISNPGNATLTISQTTIAGTGFSIVSGASAISIPAGQSQIVTIRFTPSSAGNVSGSITFASNVTGTSFSVPLSGAGLSPGSPGITTTLSSVSFGSIAIGSPYSQAITIQNPGSATLTITQATVSGAGFSFNNLPLPMTLPAGTNNTFYAVFGPTSTASVTGSITLISNAPSGPYVIALSGSGAQGLLAINPSPVNFGSVAVGGNSSQTVTISNSGTGSTTVSQITASGSGFSYSGIQVPFTLAGGQNTSFTAKFAPASIGSVSGGISVVSNAASSPSTVTLNGTGTQAGISSTPSSLNFGNVTVGSPSSQTVLLSNTGSSSLTITQASVAGAGYSVNGLALPVTIAAGGNTTFNVVFVPASGGSVSGSISVVSNAPNSPLAIPLSGTGVQAGISATPSSVAFGNVTVGSPNSQTIRLSNTGSSALTITQANISGAGFSLNGLAIPITIPAGGNTTFNVVFGPASGGAVSGSVNVVSSAPSSPLAIPLSGTGVATTTLLGASASSLSFGNVGVGSNSSQNLLLTNNGNTTVTISGINVTGTGYGSSGVSVGQSIAAGQSATVGVTFTPASAATVSGNVTITSNATNSPVNISLSGTGTQTPVAHSVTLSWTASSSTVVGYNIYRSTTSGGPYTLLNSSPVPGITFTDTTVQAGVTYFYVVTAVDSSGNESVYSNEASATVPTP